MTTISLTLPVSLGDRLRANLAERLAKAASVMRVGAVQVALDHGTILPAAIASPPIPRSRQAAGLLGGMILALTAFTNAGAAIVTNRITQAGTAPKNIGWGTGTNNAAVGDTTLQTEAAPTTSGGRTVATESRTTGSVTNDQYTVTGTVTAVSTLAITEAGLFDAVSAGNLLIRSNFSAVNVVSGDSIAFTFNLRFVPSAV